MEKTGSFHWRRSAIQGQRIILIHPCSIRISQRAGLKNRINGGCAIQTKLKAKKYLCRRFLINPEKKQRPSHSTPDTKRLQEITATNTQLSQLLDPFAFAAFRLTLEAIDELRLPAYKGSALRGSFGHAFRRVICPIHRKECDGCELAARCVYFYIFETMSPEDDPFVRNKKDKAPHPYVIRPPLDRVEEYGKGEELAFDLILIGKAIDYLPYFAYTFIHMGKTGLGKGRGKFFLKRIDTIDLDGTSIELYQAGDEILRNESAHINCGLIIERCPPAQRCTLRFLTRLELKEKRKYPEINFSILFRRLLARIATLAHLHCGIDCTGIDFSGLSRAADSIKTVSSNLVWENAVRYSNRQRRRMPFGGLLGEITFEGDLAPFWPYILLGEWVHVGKKTSFGLGRYELGI